MAKKKYTLTDEHRAQLKPWADKWIANAMSTKAMDDEDRAAMRVAIAGMYDAADLPQPKNIVFVPSPLVLALAGSFAAGIWHVRKNGLSGSAHQATWQAIEQATYQATEQATDQATWQATEQATRQATAQATAQATEQATAQATEQATDQATWQATEQATRQETWQATWQATGQATGQATEQATEQATAQATEQETRQATWQATAQATRQETWQATEQATRQATRQATEQSTSQATAQATRQATEQATEPATRQATEPATRQATAQATRQETWQATWQATGQATGQATRQATEQAIQSAESIVGEYAKFLLSCCSGYYRMWDGGNQWSGWISYLSFFRHIAKLDLPAYEKWQHYENAAIHGGPRIMHEDFCMVSDRPEILLIDEDNRPHCDTGSSHRWRDGWSLWYIHGVRVTEQIVMRPETMTAKQILAEENAEVRRVMIDRFTPARLMLDSDATKVATDEQGTLWRLPIPDDEDISMVELLNSTVEPDGSRKTYWLRVPPDVRTPAEAVAWTFDLSVGDYLVSQAS